MRLLTFALLVLTMFGHNAFAAGPYKVASDCTWPPMELLDDQKQPTGYSVDYIKEAGRI